MLKLSKIGGSIMTSVLKLVKYRKLYYTASPAHLGEGDGLQILSSDRYLWTVHLFPKEQRHFLSLITKYNLQEGKTV